MGSKSHRGDTKREQTMEKNTELLLLMSVHCHDGINRGWWVQEPLYMSISLLILLLTPHPTAVTLGQDQVLSPLSHQCMPLSATLCKYINSTASERGHYQQKREWGPDIKSIIIQHAPTRLSVKSPADMFVWTDDAIKMLTVLLVSKGEQQW